GEGVAVGAVAGREEPRLRAAHQFRGWPGGIGSETLTVPGAFPDRRYDGPSRRSRTGESHPGTPKGQRQQGGNSQAPGPFGRGPAGGFDSGDGVTEGVTMSTYQFSRRHIGLTPEDIESMLGHLDVGSVDELIDQAVPSRILTRPEPDLPAALDETEVLEELRRIASRNQRLTSLIGLGYYGTITPPVILRNVLESPAWYTAYTPYQAEISQGRLEALLNFQTMVADLTGLEVANASLLDEGTAAAEAMAMAGRLTRREGTFFIDTDCHPQTIAVVETRAEAMGIDVQVVDLTTVDFPDDSIGVLVQ